MHKQIDRCTCKKMLLHHSRRRLFWQTTGERKKKKKIQGGMIPAAIIHCTFNAIIFVVSFSACTKSHLICDCIIFIRYAVYNFSFGHLRRLDFIASSWFQYSHEWSELRRGRERLMLFCCVEIRFLFSFVLLLIERGHVVNRDSEMVKCKFR